jgi:hypothetical protein
MHKKKPRDEQGFQTKQLMKRDANIVFILTVPKFYL